MRTLLCVIAMLCMIGGAAVAQANLPVTADFRDAPVADALEAIAAVSGMDLEIEGDAPSGRITSRFDRQPAGVVAEAIAESAGYECETSGNALIVREAEKRAGANYSMAPLGDSFGQGGLLGGGGGGLTGGGYGGGMGGMGGGIGGGYGGGYGGGMYGNLNIDPEDLVFEVYYPNYLGMMYSFMDSVIYLTEDLMGGGGG